MKSEEESSKISQTSSPDESSEEPKLCNAKHATEASSTSRCDKLNSSRRVIATEQEFFLSEMGAIKEIRQCSESGNFSEGLQSTETIENCYTSDSGKKITVDKNCYQTNEYSDKASLRKHVRLMGIMKQFFQTNHFSDSQVLKLHNLNYVEPRKKTIISSLNYGFKKGVKGFKDDHNHFEKTNWESTFDTPTDEISKTSECFEGVPYGIASTVSCDNVFPIGSLKHESEFKDMSNSKPLLTLNEYSETKKMSPSPLKDPLSYTQTYSTKTITSESVTNEISKQNINNITCASSFSSQDIDTSQIFENSDSLVKMPYITKSTPPLGDVTETDEASFKNDSIHFSFATPTAGLREHNEAMQSSVSNNLIYFHPKSEVMGKKVNENEEAKIGYRVDQNPNTESLVTVSYFPLAGTLKTKTDFNAGAYQQNEQSTSHSIHFQTIAKDISLGDSSEQVAAAANFPNYFAIGSISPIDAPAIINDFSPRSQNSIQSEFGTKPFHIYSNMSSTECSSLNTEINVNKCAITAIQYLNNGDGSTILDIMGYVRAHLSILDQNLSYEVRKALKKATSEGTVKTINGKYVVTEKSAQIDTSKPKLIKRKTNHKEDPRKSISKKIKLPLIM